MGTLTDIRLIKQIDNDTLMDNFEMLQVTPYKTGTTTERLAIIQVAGMGYYDTTLKTFFISNGSNWVEVK